MIYVSPSLLSANLSDLNNEMKKLLSSGADYAHVDIMDGNFVRNIAFGPSFVSSLKKCSSLPLDVHLMIKSPISYIDNFINAGSDIITIHIETVTNEDFDIIEKKVHEKGIKLGLTLRPSTDFNLILPYLSRVDMVLVMSVEPGFSGQKFMPIGLDRLKELSRLRKENNYSYLLEIDGGVDNTNYKACIEAGVDIIVSGSYLFSSEMERKIKEFKE